MIHVDRRAAPEPTHKETAMNNKFKAALLSGILVFGLASSAYAGPRHGGHSDRHAGSYSQRGHHAHRSRDNWGGVAAAVIITGVIAAAIANSQRQQQIEAAPPQPAYTPGGTWYYCASAGQYYPQVDYCPEGWRPVQQ